MYTNKNGLRSLSLLSVLAVFLLWWIVAANEWFSPLFLPSPKQVWFAFLDIWSTGYKGSSLALHISESLFRLGSAFLLALLTAIPLGLISGYIPAVRAIFDPFIEFYRPLPPLAYYTM